MEIKEIDKYESSVIDIDEVEGTDIKINPSYYIHLALCACQKALEEEHINIKERVANYLLRVSHFQSVCIASKMITKGDDFFTEIKDFSDSKQIKEEKEEYQKNFKLAQKKYELLAERVFSNQLMTVPLKLR